MELYKQKCYMVLKEILNRLSDARDIIDMDGPGYNSEIDKELKSIEKKVEKTMNHLREESC